MKKVLSLDCDNTLWEGIVGEDGVNNIKPYKEFQQELINLHKKGVILVLCSKNNEDDVINAFKRHPGMVLQLKHITAMKVNWEDKPGNLTALAEGLNLSLDSFVHVDDSDYELSMIDQFLPDVETVRITSEREKHRTLLHGVFPKGPVTEEDRKRGILYKEEMDRKKAERKMDEKEFLSYLKMMPTITHPRSDDPNIPRLAQLTQRTNQFNFSTKRYTENDIIQFIKNEDDVVFYLSLKDRFGDLGIVGLMILRCYPPDDLRDSMVIVDTFLLSCRVLGRKVEYMLYNLAKSFARHLHAHLVFSYEQTDKNVPAQNFIEKEDLCVST